MNGESKFHLSFRVPAGVQNQSLPLGGESLEFAQFLEQNPEWYDEGAEVLGHSAGHVILTGRHGKSVEAFFEAKGLPVKARQAKGQKYLVITPLPVYQIRKAAREKAKASQ